MGERRPYQERWTVGSLVRVAPEPDLQRFMESYRLHHSLRPEQLKYAGVLTTVRALAFYHGGDLLYKLNDTGDWYWLEPCLRDPYESSAAIDKNLMSRDIALVPERYRVNSRSIGPYEIVWRGDDILEVLEVLSQKGAVILGVESVEFREAGSGPVVEAICDTSMSLEFRQAESWPDRVRLSREKAIADIERNVKNPYGDDIWYCLVIEPAPASPPKAGAR